MQQTNIANVPLTLMRNEEQAKGDVQYVPANVKPLGRHVSTAKAGLTHRSCSGEPCRSGRQ
eukprot:scaffold171319_cov19-Tisochrysis_lutea.AAC.3